MQRWSWVALVCFAPCAACGATDEESAATGGATATGGRSDAGGSGGSGAIAGDAPSATGGVEDGSDSAAGQAGAGASDSGAGGEVSGGAAGASDDAEVGGVAGHGGDGGSGELGGSGGDGGAEPAPPDYPECEPDKVYRGSWKACFSEDLERLRDVTTFEGTLYVDRQCNAADLEPMRCLKHVDGFLSINTDVESLDFIRGLETVTGSLFLDSTSDIVLANLVSVGGDLQLDGREASLAFPKLVSVGSMLRFGGPALSRASFPELETVGGSLAISSASALEHLPDFRKLTSANHLFLVNNGITDLQGLELLRELGIGLEISSNPALRDLRGLVGLERVGSFSVVSNPALPTCEAEWLRDRLTITDGVGIGDNDDAGECP
jgi:hypothetical protein